MARMIATPKEGDGNNDDNNEERTMSSERLIEAARAVVAAFRRSDATPIDYDESNAMAELESALPPASPAPAPAKGVRCWRRAGGFLGTNPISTDRLRERPDGTLEWVRRDGSVLPSHDKIEDYASNLANGSWVECPDAPYVAPVVKDFLTTAPPVAAPAPAMPPEGTRFIWRLSAPDFFDLEVVGGQLVRKFRNGSPDSSAHMFWTIDEVRKCGSSWKEVPPTPAPAVESADACAERIRCTATRKGECDIITARDAVISAARDRTIAERDAEVRVLKGQLHMANEDYEMANAERNDLRAHLAEREAGGGEDKELLETARRLMPSLVTANPQACPGEVAGDCVNYAKLLHAALSERGQG